MMEGGYDGMDKDGMDGQWNGPGGKDLKQMR